MVAGSHGAKREQREALDVVQARSRQWWEATPMSYDWHRDGSHQPLTAGWFDDQDRRFLAAARFYATDRVPFDRLIPYAELADRDVLEIGVGSGLHAELLAKAGARVTGIDLTEAAIERTRRRFELRGLQGRFYQWDAEQTTPELDRTFDFIWSWGVIHHSSRTALIVRNVHRWLRPGGSFAGMVYHRDSINAAALLVYDWLLRRGLFAHSVDEALWRGTDGYMARFYPADQWRDLLLAFFGAAGVRVLGQKSEVVPLPGPLRRRIVPLVPDRVARAVVHRCGSFVTFWARDPLMD